jgi:hypothetical protein
MGSLKKVEGIEKDGELEEGEERLRSWRRERNVEKL